MASVLGWGLSAPTLEGAVEGADLGEAEQKGNLRDRPTTSCDIQTASGTGLAVYCQAQDANGVTASCSSTAQNFVQLVGMMNSDSH